MEPTISEEIDNFTHRNCIDTTVATLTLIICTMCAVGIASVLTWVIMQERIDKMEEEQVTVQAPQQYDLYDWEHLVQCIGEYDRIIPNANVYCMNTLR